MAREPSIVVRRWLGVAVLLFTIGPAYFIAHRSIAHTTTRQPCCGVDANIREAASRYDVPEDLIAAVIETESQFDPYAVSPRGAQGLMQLMPSTSAILGVRDPFDPQENITGGVRHLRSLMDRFDNDLPRALAAYNAGEKAVLDHGGVPPYRETREYVSRILRRLDRHGFRPPQAPATGGARPPSSLRLP
jgi:soluble lytic murein transglycosylase-like protein